MRTGLLIPTFIFTILFNILSFSSSQAQTKHQDQFSVSYSDENNPSIHVIGKQSLLQLFNDKDSALRYFQRLPAVAQSEGYLAFSVDSISIQDSFTIVKLYLGRPTHSIFLDLSQLKKFTWLSTYIPNRDSVTVSFIDWKKMQQQILDGCENHGYPFASVGLNDVLIDEHGISGTVSLNESVFYHIDSISIKGTAKINNRFLQRHLFITNGMPYDAEKLKQVDQRISTLGFVSAIQPSDLTMLGSGSVLNVYLKPKKNSQFNFLLGLQPESGGKKLRLTGDLNADLKNLLGSGEQFIFKWQQLQPLSPRLNIGYSQPYVFHSSIGIDARFGLFKKDSSFLQVNTLLGTSVVWDAHQQGGGSISWQSNHLLSGAVDTAQIISTRTLPQDIDMDLTSIGIHYQWDHTDYVFNPRKGTILSCKLQAGLKTISINNDIRNIRTPGFDALRLYDSFALRDYQIRIQASATHFFPIGKYATIKTALQGGALFSRSIFRNECFQLGGAQLLRGFDAESIFARNYLIATGEYRFLFARDAYFAFFTDWARTLALYGRLPKTTDFLSAGGGLQYQTKSGLLNLSLAVGKRMDLEFDIRSSTKIHFGYINYF